MNKYYLLEFSDYYCDEFKVQGFQTITEKQFEVLQFVENNKNKIGKALEIGFGSNDTLFYDSIEDFLNCINISEITQNDYNIIQNIFRGGYGLVEPFKEVKYLFKYLKKNL